MQPHLAGMRVRSAVAMFFGAVCLCLSHLAQAQWLNYKTPGIPRTPDGKPDLSAPAPRMPDGKPDLSGLWRVDAKGVGETAKAEDAVQLQAWAQAVTDKRKESVGRDAPSVLCLPSGPQVEMGVGKVVQGRNSLAMLWGGTQSREVFLDGRSLPDDPNPTWMGYSVGHWEGDTLVIESAGFNDKTWFDDDGRPHTEALHVTERLHRLDLGHMEVVRTFVDPGALLKPWTVPVKLELDADNEQLEYVCNENERDHEHLVGKLSDDKGVSVPTKVLARYVGEYQVKFEATKEIITFSFKLNADHLSMTGVGPAVQLIATSDTEFAGPGFSLRFVKRDGPAREVYIQAVEGSFKGVRK